MSVNKTKPAELRVVVLRDNLTGWYYNGEATDVGPLTKALVLREVDVEPTFRWLVELYQNDMYNARTENDGFDLCYQTQTQFERAKARQDLYGDNFGIEVVTFTIPYEEPA